MLSTFTVTSPADAGPGTLRDAITQSNADTAQPNTITFSLDAADRTIALATPLPDVTAAVTIDGTSTPAAPLVTISGASGVASGLTVDAAGTTIQGLAFGGFSGTALTLKAGGATVQGNDFGTAGDGTTAAPNGTAIQVAGSNDVIGGTAQGAGNLIANNASGIVIANHADGNTITANTIGANAGPGVIVVNSDRNTISANSIAGNQGPGILLDPRTGDVAPNALLPAPTLNPPTGADSASATVTGSFQGTPNTSGYRIEVFASADGGPAAQGDTYLGSVTAATDANGNGTFSLDYTPVAGKPVLTATLTDPQGNTSAFSGPNAAPVNQVPAPLTVDQDLPVVFSAAGGNPVLVSDPLRPDNNVQVALSVTRGTLTLSGLNGLTGTGNGTGALNYTGTLAQIDAALTGMIYRPSHSVPGPVTLTLTSTSLAGPGQSGPLSSTSTTTINVRSIAMPPNALSSYTSLNQQSSSGLVITPSPYGPQGVTSFQITQIQHGTLYQSDGVTPISDGDFINLQQAAAGLKFTPDTGFIGVGSFTVQASRDGTVAGLAGPAAYESITVNRVPITTTLTSSQPSTLQGKPVILTATVSPGVDGTITFLDGTNPIGTVALSQASASLSVSDLTVGTHAITAMYSGDQGRAASASSPIIQTVVAPAPTRTVTALAASSTSVSVGQPVTLSASVAPAPAGGTVTFLDGSTILGSESLQGGSASLTIPVLTAGTHQLTANFNGTGTDASSHSAPVTVSVQVPVPTTTGTSSPGSGSNSGPGSNTGGNTTGTGNAQGNGNGATNQGSPGTGSPGTQTSQGEGGTQTARGAGGTTTPTVQAPTSTTVSVAFVRAHRQRYASITARVSTTQPGVVPSGGIVTFFGPTGQSVQMPMVNGVSVYNLPFRRRPRGMVTAVYGGTTAFAGSESATVPMVPHRVPRFRRR